MPSSTVTAPTMMATMLTQVLPIHRVARRRDASASILLVVGGRRHVLSRHGGTGSIPRRAIVLAVVLGFVALTLAMPLRTFFTQRAELDQVARPTRDRAGER